MQEAAYWILFQKVFGYGTARSQKILDHYGHPGEIFDAAYGSLASSGVFTRSELNKISMASVQDAEEILDRCRCLRCRVVFPGDPGYPQRLREVYAPPAVLYLKGSLEGWENSLAIAMVGTRSPTSYGRRVAADLSYDLARRGVVVVSGLALGIDAEAHSAALRANGRTVAVLGCGIDVVYPASNRELYRRILERRGALVSEFPPGSSPAPYRFPIRNRIISGLCQGTVVVEGAYRSGSLITAGHALAQGRDVFAVPGSIYSSMSQASNWLIAQGAIPVTGCRDILREYAHLIQNRPDPSRQNPEGFDNIDANVYNRQQGNEDGMDQKPAAPTARQNNMPLSCLTETQRAVYNALEAEASDTDTIIARCGLPARAVLAALTQLELFGCLKVYPGGRFSL